MASHKMRLDDLLVQEGYFPNREAALRAVIAHEVRVDDVYPTSAAIMVSETSNLFVKNAKRFVSRGGHKLQAALDAFGECVQGKHCIDVGSSTGGFSDCLLQAGAASVTCVDVNYGQLAWQLRQDARVRVFERTNIRLANPEQLGAPFDIVVCDVSFIGLAATFAQLCHPGSVFIGLIKPQFESQPGETEEGVVVDEAIRKRVVDEVVAALQAAGFTVSGVITSPLSGPQGNIEFLVRAVY